MHIPSTMPALGTTVRERERGEKKRPSLYFHSLVKRHRKEVKTPRKPVKLQLHTVP